MKQITKGKPWLTLLRNEDWLAVWLGFLILAVLLAGLSLALPGWRWSGGAGFRAKAFAWSSALAALERPNAFQPGREQASRLKAALDGGHRPEAREAAAALERALQGAADTPQAASLAKLAGEVRAEADSTLGRIFSGPNLLRLLLLFLALSVLLALAAAAQGLPLPGTLAGFPVLFLLAALAMLIGGNSRVSYWGLETVLWALALGLLLGNLFPLPSWLRGAVRTELFIKIGLVLLGAETLFSSLARVGGAGLIQAVVVITAVFYFCFWVARKLGLDEDFAAILSTGVSVCGVSAAIAAGGALKGDPKKVSHAISLILLCAVPMLIGEPLLGRLLRLTPPIAGAWIGGTIDTTGAVVAAGSMAGAGALSVAVVVKMAQNVLIGVVALLLALWASWRKKGNEKPRVGEIWTRFPKFVLGFLAASLLFSLLLTEGRAKAVTALSAPIRGWLFTLAFTCIGLETRVKDLVTMGGGRPAAAFLLAQLFNILLTLGLAFLLFGGLLFGGLRP